MLIEFRNLGERDPKRLERVTHVINHLLRHQFFHLDDRGAPGMMETLLRPDIEKLVASYFEVAGYRLVVRDIEGWAGILPDTEVITGPRMRIDETLVLLLMRRLWGEGDLGKYGNMLTTLNEAYDAYQDMVGGSRRPALGITEFRNLVQSLERRAIVRLGEYDDEAHDMPLTIRALVDTVSGTQHLTGVEQLLSGPDLQDNDEELSEEDKDAAE